MRILIIGGGGREHALAWKCAAPAHVERVWVAPGNAGTAVEPKVTNAAIAATDLPALVAFAREARIDLTIVGPEAPLVAGVVDAFEAAGLRCFGPRAAAAQLEGSKAYAKAFMHRHGIPTAAYRVFTRESYDSGWVLAQRAPLVVKASGLAAGKGVVIAPTSREADQAARAMFDGSFGSAGQQVVVEEFLEGEEASFIVMARAEHALVLASSQDHKRLGDGDRGPNTGGMGAYSPAPVVTAALEARVLREVIAPTLTGLRREGIEYTGFLYAGLMIGPDGAPRVLEYNCRLGDPETQPILMRLRSDLAELCLAALENRLEQARADWDPRAALGVVLAAAGYPEEVRTGDVISIDPRPPADAKLFHAGTQLGGTGGEVRTSGGRVACAVGLGQDLAAARERAYALVEQVRFAGMQYRRDIGFRALMRPDA